MSRSGVAPRALVVVVCDGWEQAEETARGVSGKILGVTRRSGTTARSVEPRDAHGVLEISPQLAAVGGHAVPF